MNGNVRPKFNTGRTCSSSAYTGNHAAIDGFCADLARGMPGDREKLELGRETILVN
jgi:hypothetical protein